ncbi:MAG: CHAT domain-containing protein, partial [Acidobacteria bacterium]|nr:CHAT domain-containing protein [Acidobacteriota bacterium]
MPKGGKAFAFLLLACLVAGAARAATLGSSGAQQALQRGRYGEALKQWESLLAGQRGKQRFDTLLSMANAYQALGRVEKAFRLLAEAEALAEETPDKARRALVLGSLSDAFLLTRRLEEALHSAERAVSLARQTSAPGVLAASLNHLGNALMAEQRYPEALGAYREGAVLAERAGDGALAAALLTNAVHAQFARDAPAEAFTTLAAALQKNRSLAASHDKAVSLIALGHLGQRLAESLPEQRDALIRTAHGAFDDANALAEALDDVRTKAYATGHLGEIHAMQGRHQDAQRLFHRALFFAAQVQAPELAARWHWQLGRSLKSEGRRAEAKMAYTKALDDLGSVQSALVFGQRGNPQSFRETIGAVHLDLAEILLREADNIAAEPARQTLLRQVRDVMEGFKAAELRDHFLDECVTALQQRIDRSELDRLLDRHTAALYPVLFPDRIVLLVSFAGGTIRYLSVAVDAAEVRRTLTAFRKELATLGNPRKLRKHGRDLYRWLMEPVTPMLADKAIDTLVVVPDEALRTIPFAALFDGRDFLIKRYAFAITPGLTLTDPEVFAGDRHRLLQGGLSESVQGFEKLTYVPEQMKETASLYGGRQLLDKDFQKRNVDAELNANPFSAIAFATHAQIQSDPRKSFLLTYDDRITLDDLERLLRIGQFREQPVELMVLSACDT